MNNAVENNINCCVVTIGVKDVFKENVYKKF